MIPGPLLLSGATGLVGDALATTLADSGVAVRALTRDPSRLRPLPGVTGVRWNGVSPPPDALRGARAVVHLSGEPVLGLPTPGHLRRVRESRIESTTRLVEGVASLPPDARPEVFVCASAVGFYGDRAEDELTEDATPGAGFLADLCAAWEAAAERVEALGVRRVSVRFGVVLSQDGGALAAMATPFRLGLGGRLGTGRQWFPWVHLDDAVGIVRAALEDPRLRGPLNAVAPEPVRNAEFTRTLAGVLRRPALVRVPAFVLRGVLGPLAGELLGSKRVVPLRAQEAGVRFRYPLLRAALRAEFG